MLKIADARSYDRGMKIVVVGEPPAAVHDAAACRALAAEHAARTLGRAAIVDERTQLIVPGVDAGAPVPASAVGGGVLARVITFGS